MQAVSHARPAPAAAPPTHATIPQSRHAVLGNQALLRRLAPVVRRKCATCEDEDKQVQTKSAAPGMAGEPAPAAVEQTLQTPGKPLDPGLRDFFEPRFGADFSAVRLHTDARAAESASQVGARAYAAGSDLVFASGAYTPETSSGRELIAHELAHVVQQTGGAPPALRRRVVGVTCTAGSKGAPADPRKTLETADTIAIRLSGQVSAGLAADASTVRGGIPATPSATLTAFRDHFGFPPAQGGGFLNRLTGTMRPTQEIALSEELTTVSQRFAGTVGLLNQGLNYNCVGDGAVNLIGCSAGTCAGNVALTCRGNSLVALCTGFWTGFDDIARAHTIIHESMHIQFGAGPGGEPGKDPGLVQDATTRGPGRNFNIAGCYEGVAADVGGGNPTFICPAPP